MIYKFTKKAENAIKYAKKFACDMGHLYVGSEHLLYGLLKEKEGVASRILEEKQVDEIELIQKIEYYLGKNDKTEHNAISLTPRTKQLIEIAFRETTRFNSKLIGTEHLLSAMTIEVNCVAAKILIDMNIDLENMYNEILDLIVETEEEVLYTDINDEPSSSYKQSITKTETLNQFSIDLTMLSKEGKLDPVIGRKEETDRVIQILSRRTKNNPCLIGEPGVGKTAVIEGLAEKIVLGNVPEILKNKRVVSLDLSGMVAGAKYRGDFEERIKKVLSEIKKVGDIILFIDEIHYIVGAGGAEGAIDAANILKPLLARGEIQLIGATTSNEYRKYIEKDAALERRFQTIVIEEPTFAETVKILKGLRDKYETHHKVKITDNAIITAIELSKKYIQDKFLPDKAIDLIDEAASKARVIAFATPNEIKSLEAKIQEINIEKESAINAQDFEKAAEIRDMEKTIKKELKNEYLKWEEKKMKEDIWITEEEISIVLSKNIGIPVNKISQSENQRLKNLEKELHKRVVGQDEAIKLVAKAIRRNRVGLGDSKKPIGSFMFLGPTGVGKTELSKTLAEALFGDEKALVRIDMSEFMEKYSVSKLIGSPPGYVGYDENNNFTEKIRKKPYSVILFDEIEKAHIDIVNILLQILDDGILTDSSGRKIDFKNTVIIMTSNIGASKIIQKSNLGFNNGNKIDIQEENSMIKKDVMNEVKKEFKPEFLNRIDDIVIFNKLDDKDVNKIVNKMINNVQKRLIKQDIELNITDEVKKFIIENGKNNQYGARPLKRAIQKIVEDTIAENIIGGNVKKGDKIELLKKDNEIMIDKL